MPRAFASVNDAIDFMSAELTEMSADALVSRIVALTLLRRLAASSPSSEDWSEVTRMLRQQLERVEMDGGDADVNLLLKRRARERLENLLRDVERAPSGVCGRSDHRC